MNDTPHVNMQLAVAHMSIHVALKEFAAARDVLLAALDSQANLPEQLTTSSVYRYLRDIAREMAVERNEREKERALLYGALPKEIADRMVRGESVSGDRFDHAAVMFLDVVDFTDHSSVMDAGDVVHLLESLFKTFDGLCVEHNVMKVKTIGDSYMCFKGDGLPHENATALAHRALAWGDTVNVASRMESNAVPVTVNVSADMSSVLHDNADFTVESRGELEVKGKGAMEMYTLTRA